VAGLLILSSTTPCQLWLDTCVSNQRTFFLSSRKYNLLSFVAKDPHCPRHGVPWSLNICSTQISPVHREGTHGVSNRDVHLYPTHHSSSINLTTTTEVRHSVRITDGRRSGWRALWDSILSSPTSALTFLEWPFQE